jgi:hypothetical protein
MSLTLSFFPTRNAEGRELEAIVVELAGLVGLNVKVHSDPSPGDYMFAAQNDDLVVLDATRAPSGEHNYGIAAPLPLDHVLVVSRNYLPLNFYGLHDGVVDAKTNSLTYGAPFYPGTQSNESIRRWLTAQLREFLSAPRGTERGRGLFATVFKEMPRSLDAVDRRRHETGEIFISYRSHDSKQVEALKQRIESGKFIKGARPVIRYFPPALFSDELATEQRRWQILSMIDRFMSPASEVWVYETERYYDSWWTLGELATLAHRRDVDYRGKPAPRLRIYDPAADTVRDPPADYLPKMTNQQHQRMARWFANCDTASLAPESVAAIKLMSQLPLIGQVKYFQDHVWSEEFWRHPILDCNRCRTIGSRRSHFDMEAFLWTRDRGITRLTPEEMDDCVRAGEVVCPKCNSAYPIVEDSPHYLWTPIVNGHRTGEYWAMLFNLETQEEGESFLVTLPTFRLE